MKNFLIAIFLLISLSATAQITVSTNAAVIDSVGATTVKYITLPTNLAPVTLLIKLPSTNASTVRINTESSTMINCVAYPAGSYVWVTTKTGKIWFKLENSDDDLEISW
jgi:hypothetical protein